MIASVSFIAADNDPGDSVLVFTADFYDMDEDGIYNRRHLKEDVLQWCREHMLRVGMTYSELSQFYNGEIWFDDEAQRFEFKMRWNV